MERTVEIKKVELEADEFDEPQPGDEVCCNVGGGRYSAVVQEWVCAEVHTVNLMYLNISIIVSVLLNQKKDKGAAKVPKEVCIHPSQTVRESFVIPEVHQEASSSTDQGESVPV